MRALLSIFIVISMFFAGVTQSYAFGKSKVKKAPAATVEQSSDASVTIAKTKKAKKTKVKKEKVKKEKIKEEKTKKEKVKKQKKLEEEKITSENTDKVVAQKEKKAKKEKKTKKDNNAKNQTTIPQTTAEKEGKKRTFLGKFLNPNLDIYEIRASHILVKKRKDALSIRKDILNGDITFEEAAKRYSLCPTGPYGGDLGYFNRRKMDQLFTDIAFDLKIGEISDPVGTKFGWHLIKVVDKR